MTQRWAVRVAACLVVLVALDWVVCELLLRRLQASYAQWQQSVESQGWEVTTGPVAGGGFPLGAALRISEVTLRGGQALVPGGVDWHAQRVELGIGLLHPWSLEVAPQGQQVIRVATGKALVVNADHLLIEVPLGGGRPDHIGVAAESITAGLLGSGHPQDVRIDGLDLQLNATSHSSARIELGLEVAAHGFELPDTGRWPLGGTISHVDAAATLASPALSGRAPAEQARAWRDWGGTLDVTRLSVKWGPLDLNGTARLGLDGDLQPEGKGHAAVAGWQAALDALAESGTLDQGMAQTAKAVLGVMPTSKGPGGEERLNVTIAMKHNVLALDGIPVVHVRPLNWGGV